MKILKVPNDIRTRLLDPYRPERLTPRTDVPGNVMSDPAPPWVSTLIAELWVSVGGNDETKEATIARSLIWCNAGEPRTRAENLIQLARLWPGDASFEVLCFIEECCKLEAGKAKGSKYRVRRAVRIPEKWEPDETGRLVGFDRGQGESETALTVFESDLSGSAKMIAVENMATGLGKDPIVMLTDRVLELEKALEPFANGKGYYPDQMLDKDIGRFNYDSGITQRHIILARVAMGIT